MSWKKLYKKHKADSPRIGKFLKYFKKRRTCRNDKEWEDYHKKTTL